MREIKLGLIGLGYIGKTHLYNCLRLDGAKLVALADISKGAQNKAKQLGIKYIYDDYKKMLENPEVDGVIIALPTHLHANCAIAAAEYHKDILVEKPLARNIAEAHEILSKAQTNKIKVMVGHPLRFSPPFISLKTRIDDFEFGDIQVAYATDVNSGPFIHRAETGAPVPVPDWWWKTEYTGGGALIDLGSHMINLAQWYFGDVVSARSLLGIDII
jgi:predicted dehydrogenase